MDALTLEGFTQTFLLPRYDNPKPIPAFHRQLWEWACSDDQYGVAAAPRGFAKSTAITLAYTLSKLLFRENDFVLILSDTESQAIEFVKEIAVELQENDDLLAAFGGMSFIKDTEADIIIRCADGYMFRVIARGSEQKLRGLKWRSKRPNLVIGDDLENDEIVLNPHRRKKFRDWISSALLPAGADNCVYRFVGTVLHFDAWLERSLISEEWNSVRFKAHKSFSDFSELLWPEKFPEKRLRATKRKFVSDGNPEGYSQEFLNNPIAEGSTFFRMSDFIPMSGDDRAKKKTNYVLGDLAISKSEQADETVFIVAGLDEDGVIHVFDAHAGKWDGLEIMEKMFELQVDYRPEIMGVEEEKIKKAIGPFVRQEMMKRNVYISFPDPPLVPSKDKQTRAHSIRARMRAGGVRFDDTAEWYDDMVEQCIRFPRGAHDDYVDVLAWLGLLLDRMVYSDPIEEDDEEEFFEEPVGRSVIGGY